MITYRDMTFCTGDGCQSFSRCLRAYTPEIAQAARNSGRPLSLMRSTKRINTRAAAAPSPVRNASPRAEVLALIPARHRPSFLTSWRSWPPPVTTARPPASRSRGRRDAGTGGRSAMPGSSARPATAGSSANTSAPRTASLTPASMPSPGITATSLSPCRPRSPRPSRPPMVNKTLKR